MSNQIYLSISFVLLVYVILSNALSQTKNKVYNEASLATIFGIILGVISNLQGINTSDTNIFFEIILPIIIMGAAQEVDLKMFHKNFNYILWYGIIGTFINFIGLFCFLFLFYEFFKLDLLSNANLLLLSATLTATDTVSILSLIKKQKFPKVHSIIFGEGLLNDSVAIILFKLTLNLNSLNEELNILDFKGLFFLLQEFFKVSFLSILIGIVISYLYLVVCRRIYVKKENKIVVEICLMVLFGFFTFYFTEFLNCSGLLAIFCFIIVHTNYSKNIIEKEANEGISHILKTASYICEAISFIYLGINSLSLLRDDYLWQTLLTSLMIMIGICLIRWISVGMPAFLFLCYENISLEANEIMLIWYAGLIRGSVSAGLCMIFTSENEKLRNIVVLISLFTTLILSSISNKVIMSMGFF